MKELQIKIIDINKIVKSEYNPRVIYKQEFQSLVDSIKEFGFVEPIVVNTREHPDFKKPQWTIVGGHQRYEAAKKIGYKEVPVVFVNLSPPKEKILNLALNKISGEFDTPRLAEVLYGLIEEDKLSEEEILGFPHEEISGILGTVMSVDDIRETELDENIKLTNKCPKCGYEW